ncbi:hypothetical protein IFM89_036129 [Coptis chinensis]|uniref:Uncharacterized protein n=1 Tax=Coptis chinensis TaxID=261450 RepID=A0A835LPN6_9MAGN|nr:hypothetical protein IFM89_036129 [Coptis chinensis]
MKESGQETAPYVVCYDLFSGISKIKVDEVGENNYRPDLMNAALSRLSAVYRSLKVSKSGVKKRNRQNVRIPGRK